MNSLGLDVRRTSVDTGLLTATQQSSYHGQALILEFNEDLFRSSLSLRFQWKTQILELRILLFFTSARYFFCFGGA